MAAMMSVQNYEIYIGKGNNNQVCYKVFAGHPIKMILFVLPSLYINFFFLAVYNIRVVWHYLSLYYFYLLIQFTLASFISSHLFNREMNNITIKRNLI